jgi:hypothetical protein
MSRSQGLKKKYATIVAYKKVFSSTDGKNVLLDLMAAHNVFNSVFDSNSSEMCRKEGERNVVLRLMTILKITPAEMQAFSEEIERNARSDADPNSEQSNPARIQW